MEIVFEDFQQFIDFCLDEIKRSHHNLVIYRVHEDLRKLKGSSTTFGEINYLAQGNGRTFPIEFYKESDIEWYLGNPASEIFAIYNVPESTLQFFENFKSVLCEELKQLRHLHLIDF
jgi:hypothetical protein